MLLNGTIYFSGSEMDDLRSKIKAAYTQNPNFFSEFAQNCMKNCENLKKVATETQKCSSIYPKLAAAFNDYFTAATQAACFLLPMPLIDNILAEEIRQELYRRVTKPEKIEEYLSALTFLEKENQHAEELKSFYKLCKLGRRGDAQKLDRAIARHLKKFAWIGARNMWDTTWTEQDIMQRINELKAQGKSIEEEEKHFKQVKKDAARKLKRVVKLLKLTSDDKLLKLSEIAREYAYLRTYRTDAIHFSNFQAKKMLAKIAKKFSLTYTNIIYFSQQELIGSLAKKKPLVPMEVLGERQKDYATLSIDGNFSVVSGEELQRLKTELQQLLTFQQASELKGNVAFAGKLAGVAKIVKSQFDLVKVQQGDVLVATMTFPNYISAMQRAAAFVTDEGGILCHAAIVARELAKPCVIGTKTATKVFHDGDRIEVDADAGVVRKL